MKVILTDDIRDMGFAGELKEVADGFARNYLIPRKLAVPATKGNLARVEQIKSAKANREEKRKKNLATLAQNLEGLSIDIPVHIGENDKVFGAVTQHQITDALRAKGFNIDRKAVQLDEPIRQLGVYNIQIKLYADVQPQIRVWVVGA